MKLFKGMNELKEKMTAKVIATLYQAKSERGFTLVELCIAVGVSCLLIATLVKPNLRTGLTSWGQNVISWLQDSANI